MKKINLNDGTPIYCLKENEAIVLDEHIKGYLSYDVNIKNGDTIVDVGANIGVFGLRLSNTFLNVNIHAFEPIPEIYKVLEKNAQISRNKNFKTYMRGVSNENKELDFTYYPNSPALSTAQPEIWEKDQNNFISAVQGNISNAPKKFWWAKLIPKFLTPLIAKHLTSNSQKITSSVITLSHLIETEKINTINLLKIDCEGEEINVLLGIKTEHWNIIQAIVMEVNDIENNIQKAKKLLAQKGFQNIRLEKEKGFEKTKLINIYAHKN
ncbi:MAG: hypothetical protein CMD23_05220 [Flavobacteriales bacterium]|nr:hypothetical protein [Flavobacteriales bacterium]|tara:strand:- start:1129 stop:1929 length:801 start_codon:yes stop_codon:yes gene_type:complete